MTRNTLSINSQQSGAILLELSYVLPFMLFIAFGVINLVGAFHAKISLSQAVATARLAFTRGDDTRVGGVVLSDLSAWHLGTANVAQSAAARALLSTTNEEVSAFSSSGSGYGYNAWALETFGATSHNDLPVKYSYALAYAIASMRQSVGGNVRVPCDPSAPNGAGCLECRLLNPDSGTTAQAGPLPSDADYDAAYLGIRCQYQSSDVTARAVSAMTSFFGLGSVSPFIFTRDFTFSSN